MQNIQIDSREKSRAIRKIINEFERQGIHHYVSKLYVGDYMNPDNPRVIVDRKQNLSEVYGNVCHQHERFVDEINRARKAGIRLIFLIEHGGKIVSLESIKDWYNPRLKVSPYAWNGPRLYKTLLTIKSKYGVEFEFCRKADTGQKILELL